MAIKLDGTNGIISPEYQLGESVTAANNIQLTIPVTPDGTVSLTNGDGTVTLLATDTNNRLLAPGGLLVENSATQYSIDAYKTTGPISLKVATGGTTATDITESIYQAGTSYLTFKTHGDNKAFINASLGGASTTGLEVGTTSADDLTFVTNNVKRMRIYSDGSMDSVVTGGTTRYPAYMCRAWVNFNGTGTVAIRGSGNVTSITDGGVGVYTVNFTTAMPDVNYSIVTGGNSSAGATGHAQDVYSNPTSASAAAIRCLSSTGTVVDWAYVQVAVFR